MSLTARVVLSALSRPARHRLGPDPSQVADLHVPPGAGPFPVAVVLHGGHWRTRYGKIVTRPIAADLARRGWAAWNLEYRRLGSGRGGGGGWPMTFEDVGGGIDALAALDDPRLDLAAVAAVGHSAGGLLALWAAARPAGAAVDVRRVVALAPVTNLLSAGRLGFALVGGAPAAVPERFAEADPLRRAPLDVPTLVVHARDDATVPVERSREYVAAVRSRGGEIALVETASGGHRSPIVPTSDAWRAAAVWLAGGAPG